MNRVTRKCIDVRGVSDVNDGANIQQWSCEDPSKSIHTSIYSLCSCKDPCNPKSDQVIKTQFYLIISQNEFVLAGYHNFCPQ